MWILVCATTPQPFDLYDYYAYVGIYGVRPPAQLALIPGLDPAPSTNHLFQRQLPYADMLSNMAHNCYMGSSRHNLDQGQDCGIWESGAHTCDTRSFFIAFAAAIGQPVLALLALNQSRSFAILGAGQFFVLVAIFYFHQPETPTSFYRDVIYCESFSTLSTNEAYGRYRISRIHPHHRRIS
jgi:hypothetical protein